VNAPFPDTALATALVFAKRGWYVLPVVKEGKKPMDGVGWRSQSSNREEQIRNWAKQYPDCNFGLDCGKSGITVVDVDSNHGGKGKPALDENGEPIWAEFNYERLQMDYENIPSTLSIRTPRGGMHYYFVGRTKTGNHKLNDGNPKKSGIDIKSVGGMVLIPGSKVLVKPENAPGLGLIDPEIRSYYQHSKNNRVIMLPQWCETLIGKPNYEVKNKTPIVELDKDENVKKAIEYLINLAPLAITGSGGDETAYKVITRVKDFGIASRVATDLLLEYWYDRCSESHDTDWLRQKVRNAYNYGVNPPGCDSGEASFLDAPPPDKPTKQQKSSYDNLHESMLEHGEYRQVEFPLYNKIIDPWLREKTIGMIVGDAGTGKSMFGLELAISVARGEDFLAWETVRSARVLYMDAEMAGRDVDERIDDLTNGEGPVENLVIYNDEYSHQMINKKKARITDPEWRKQMIIAMQKMKIELVILDNIASLSTEGDENAKEDWSPINQWVLKLKYMGFSVIMMHHTNKKGGQRGTSHRMDNIDYSIALNRPRGYKETDGAFFEVSFTKQRVRQKDVKKMKKHTFRLCFYGGKTLWADEKEGVRDSKWEIIGATGAGVPRDVISEYSNLKKSQINKHIKDAKAQGLLDRRGRLTKAGNLYLLESEPSHADRVKLDQLINDLGSPTSLSDDTDDEFYEMLDTEDSEDIEEG
jgi:hypothetical protein